MAVVRVSSWRSNIVVQVMKSRGESGENGFVMENISLITRFPPEKV